MAEFKLFVDLSEKDRALIEGLRVQVAGLTEELRKSPVTVWADEAPAPKAKKTTAKKPSKAEAEAAVSQAAAKVVTEEPKPEEAPQLPVEEPVHENQPVADPQVSLPELQKAITTFCVANPTKKAAVRELVKQYGANVSGVPADKRTEVLDKLKGL